MKTDDEKVLDYLSKISEKDLIKLPIQKLDYLDKTKDIDDVIVEYPLHLLVNNEYVNTFLCTPSNLKELVVGYLYCKAFINSKDDILNITINEDDNLALVEVNEDNLDKESTLSYLTDFDLTNKKPMTNDNIHITAKKIYDIMHFNLNASYLFKNTGCVHCITIYDTKEEVIVVRDDVARHNALDKTIGYCVLNDIPLNDKVVIVSGRFSFEMLKKTIRARIPIVIAKSATTSLVIDTAKKLNITLVGFVRNNKMNIYSNPTRIVLK